MQSVYLLHSLTSLLVPASFAVPVENSTVVVGNSATVECAVEGDNPITGTSSEIWIENTFDL